MKNKFLTFLLILMFMFGLSSCGFVVEEEIQISSISTKLLEDGQTMIVITYVDDVQDPTIFYLPKGQDGVAGVGIVDIKYNLSEDKNSTDVIITMSDDTTQTVTVNNGISIVGTKRVLDENDGKYYLVMEFSDGSESKVELEKGEAGDDGLSIVDFATEDVLDDNGNLIEKILTFTFSNNAGNEYSTTVNIPIVKGEAGRGITATSQRYDKQTNSYVLVVYYSDGTSEDIPIELPNITQWYSYYGSPYDIGKEGDYFFDTRNKIIYNRQADGSWTPVVSLSSSNQYCTVTFDLNDTDNTAYFEKDDFPNGGNQLLTIKNGTIASDLLPNPEKPGYRFAGWYTVTNPSINNGNFTDLTPVTANITLYAKWEKINTYTITLVDSGNVIGTINAEENIHFSSLNLFNPADKDGYKFVGWYYDSEFTTPVIMNQIVTTDLTLYAKRELVK